MADIMVLKPASADVASFPQFKRHKGATAPMVLGVTCKGGTIPMGPRIDATN